MTAWLLFSIYLVSMVLALLIGLSFVDKKNLTSKAVPFVVLIACTPVLNMLPALLLVVSFTKVLLKGKK